ncbi:hypothetical protein GLUCOINTEAF2_0203949 [Komagataeibacter intermedius AF2]|uniref:Uncharacterized protein n=1 Tax=Komagataeibacter intermedius AF2 TaxID=1458464 RepID=A0A0N0MFY4_9PROT|nr:hypothetical protein GLUCOINTEAF2_0203949 [Komagataeibacter intermedius AF2]
MVVRFHDMADQDTPVAAIRRVLLAGQNGFEHVDSSATQERLVQRHLAILEQSGGGHEPA